MVGRPCILRGSATRPTVPCTVAPIGIIVFPASETGSVTRPENVSPCLLLNVASVFSSLILTAVPAGNDRFVSAHAEEAPSESIATSATDNSFFIQPPEFLLSFDSRRALRGRQQR